MIHFFTRPPQPSDCESCPHHHVDVIGATPGADRLRLLPFFRLRRYQPRETVYAERDPGAHVAMVRSGLVKLARYSSSGNERIVRVAMPGDTIGLEVMLGGRFHHTAIAMSQVELCLMPTALVEERAQASADFAKKLMAEWHASVDDAERYLVELSTGTAQQRVARLLLYLHERLQGKDCPTLAREDMAALLGITTETTSRVVAEFKREGHLREQAQGHWTCDRAWLERIAEG